MCCRHSRLFSLVVIDRQYELPLVGRMKRMLQFAKGSWAQTILAPLFKMLEAVLELLVPLLVADIVDVGIAQGDTRYILTRVAIMIALAAVGLGFSVVAQYFAARSAVGYTARMKSALFAHIQELSFAELDKVGVATMLTRLNSDSIQVQNGINKVLRLLLRSPFVVFGAMITALLIDAKTAWIFAVLIPALLIVVMIINIAGVSKYKKAQRQLDAVTESARENLVGVRVVRAFAMEDNERRRFEEKHATLTKLQLIAGRVSALLNPLTYALVNAGIVALVWQGALRVDGGHLTQGEVLAMYNLMAQILVELIKMANLLVLLTKSWASAKRINDVLDMQPSQQWAQTEVPQADCPYAVEMDDVGLTYNDGAAPALQGVTLSVPRGSTIGVIGGTGSGKSTLIGLLPRYYDATVGHIRINGVAIEAYPKEQLRKLVGVVQQKPAIFADTIRGNLLWGNANATDDELWEAIRLAQAEDIVTAKGGLDAEIEEGGRNLSGGQRQRLSIARALVGKPSILVLDDSASALDNATDKALREAIRTQLTCTVFVVSQRTTAVADADNIVVLDEGAVVGMGTHRELLESCPVYNEIYHAQWGEGGAK